MAMRSVRFAVAAGVLAAAMAGGEAGAQEAPPVPMTREIKAQVEAGDYREALKGLLRALDLKGPAAQAYDRVELLMLRAECQLQIKESRACLDSLEAARKEAGVQGKSDGVGAAMAMALLVQRSTAFRYVPKTAAAGPVAPKPVDILDRQARPEAYKALFADELAGTRQKVRAAETVRTMPPIMEAAKSAATLRALEKAAGGGTEQSQALADSLATHAGLLLTTSLTELSNRVEAISAAANTLVTVPVPRYDSASGRTWVDQATRRRGVEPREAQELRNIQQTCGQMVTAATDLTVALDANVQTLKEIGTAATAVKTRAGGLLAGDSADAPK